MEAAFYDHATNAGKANPAEGWAMAKARRSAVNSGEAWRVEMNWKGQGRFYWEGCRYDALGLAKSGVTNGAENVVLTTPRGEKLGHDEIKAERY